jgi:hypothetical protein
VLWEIPSHLGFWDSPGDFNERRTEFLSSGHRPGESEARRHRHPAREATSGVPSPARA